MDEVDAIGGIPFTELYRRHVHEITGYIVNLTGDVHVAHDLASETFLRAYRARERYEDRGRPVRAWLMTIARNLVRDHCASAYQRTTVLMDDGIPEQSTDFDATEGAAARNELVLRIRTAVGDLPPLQRSCVFLRFFAGKSVADTARLLGRNEPAVRALQHRAAGRLRLALSPEGESQAIPRGGVPPRAAA